MAREPKGYNYSTEVETGYGTGSANLSCWPQGGIWIVRLNGQSLNGQGLSLDMKLEDFENLALTHLRQQRYTIWTPEEKTSAYAMAHMVGFLNEKDEWVEPKK